jgi:lysine-specific demethylase 3
MFQTGFLGHFGGKVDAIDHHISEIEELSKEVSL